MKEKLIKRPVKPVKKYEIFQEKYNLSLDGFIYLENEEKEFDFRTKNEEFLNKIDAFLDFLIQSNIENKEEVISLVKLKREKTEEYGKNFEEVVHNYISYFFYYDKLMEEYYEKSKKFGFNIKSLKEYILMRELSTDIQERLKDIYLNLVENCEKLREIYKENFLIINELYNKYNFKY